MWLILAIPLVLAPAIFLLGTVRAGREERAAAGRVREAARAAWRSEHGSGAHDVLVVIPAFDEAENVGTVVQEVGPRVRDRETCTVVIVDGATDDTEAVARAHGATVLVYPVNLGQGQAVLGGYELAIDTGAEVVVTLDADGQHVPAEIPRLVAPILAGDADIVIGSRTLGSYEAESAARALGLRLFNRLVGFAVGHAVTDCACGFRAIRVSELRRLDLREPQFESAEILIEASRKGLRLREEPVTLRRRAGGASKKPATLRYGWGFAKAIVWTWLR